MKKIKLDKEPFEDGRILFDEEELEIEENTVTCIVGCNGSGKTTLLNYIQNSFGGEATNLVFRATDEIGRIFGASSKDDELQPIVFARFDKNVDPKSLKNEWIYGARKMMSSTGEYISDRLGRVVGIIGSATRIKGIEDKELYLFFDDCDAGTSIDMIGEIKNVFETISKDLKKRGIKHYIILSANSFEMAKGLDCVDATTLKHMSFDDYEAFKAFVIESRKEKDERMKKAREKEK